VFVFVFVFVFGDIFICQQQKDLFVPRHNMQMVWAKYNGQGFAFRFGLLKQMQVNTNLRLTHWTQK